MFCPAAIRSASVLTFSNPLSLNRRMPCQSLPSANIGSIDIKYLEDPKDAMGPTNDPAECSTIVRGDLRERDPVAYAFIDALELTDEQINALESVINDEDDPLEGARRWASENREVVRPWIEAARNVR